MPHRPLALSALLVLVTGSLYAVQQPASVQIAKFRDGTQLVEIDVSVLDKKNRPVRGWSADDFAVTEDGASRPIEAFAAIDIPALPRRDSLHPALGQWSPSEFNEKWSGDSVTVTGTARYSEWRRFEVKSRIR